MEHLIMALMARNDYPIDNERCVVQTNSSAVYGRKRNHFSFSLIVKTKEKQTIADAVQAVNHAEDAIVDAVNKTSERKTVVLK